MLTPCSCGEPTLPFIEIFARSPDLAALDPDELIVTLSRDSAGRWWHTRGGEVVRPASTVETLLSLAPTQWRGLGRPTATGWER